MKSSAVVKSKSHVERQYLRYALTGIEHHSAGFHRHWFF